MKKTTDISSDKFTFVHKETFIQDSKFQTKQISYLRDAWRRFSKNKGSVIAAVILLILILFSLVVPWLSPLGVDEADKYYANALPRNSLFAESGFWNGLKSETMGKNRYQYLDNIEAIRTVKKTYQDEDNQTMYKVVVDTYAIGFVYKEFSVEEISKIMAHEGEQDERILYPMVNRRWYLDDPNINEADYVKYQAIYENDANYFYKVDRKFNAIPGSDDGLTTVYMLGSSDDDYVDEEGYLLGEKTANGYLTRVRYEKYYAYMHDGRAASFLFGADNNGKDIFVRLAVGGRFSLILGFCVALINILIGIVYGAIEGYYGGTTDLVMERVAEILSQVPFAIVAVLFQMHLSRVVGVVPSLFFAFVLTGWIGVAARTRMQFYRYKGQEYVLAARTLGAKDRRIIFRHILPNAIGPIITSSILLIPGVIFSESSLTYLNIVNLKGTGLTSIGMMLAAAKDSYQSYPHVLFFPAIFISILMIAFNVFGNGLRDAFNPSLRGVEE